MKQDAKSGVPAKSRRRLLTLGERLRGWVEVATHEELLDERRTARRRVLDVVKRLARYGIYVRPISGVQLRIEAAEKLLEVLDNRRPAD